MTRIYNGRTEFPFLENLHAKPVSKAFHTLGLALIDLVAGFYFHNFYLTSQFVFSYFNLLSRMLFGKHVTCIQWGVGRNCVQGPVYWSMNDTSMQLDSESAMANAHSASEPKSFAEPLKAFYLSKFIEELEETLFPSAICSLNFVNLWGCK